MTNRAPPIRGDRVVTYTGTCLILSLYLPPTRTHHPLLDPFRSDTMSVPWEKDPKTIWPNMIRELRNAVDNMARYGMPIQGPMFKATHTEYAEVGKLLKIIETDGPGNLIAYVMFRLPTRFPMYYIFSKSKQRMVRPDDQYDADDLCRSGDFSKEQLQRMFRKVLDRTGKRAEPKKPVPEQDGSELYAVTEEPEMPSAPVALPATTASSEKKAQVVPKAAAATIDLRSPPTPALVARSPAAQPSPLASTPKPAPLASASASSAGPPVVTDVMDTKTLGIIASIQDALEKQMATISATVASNAVTNAKLSALSESFAAYVAASSTGRADDDGNRRARERSPAPRRRSRSRSRSADRHRRRHYSPCPWGGGGGGADSGRRWSDRTITGDHTRPDR